jgi:hypothetical protein
MSNSNAYSHHADCLELNQFHKQSFDADRIGAMTYGGATESGRIPAAVLLAALGGGLGVTGAALASDEKNRNKNMLLAGLLGTAGGAAGGYFGADLPTGVARNSELDPTFGGQNLSAWLNDLITPGTGSSLTLGQLGLGALSYGDSKLRGLIKD